MIHDALGAHARDEIRITTELSAQPMQAAFGSAAAFSMGAAIPLLTAIVVPASLLVWIVPSVAIAAATGGASLFRGAIRVYFWGTVAMGLTAAVGKLFGIAA